MVDKLFIDMESRSTVDLRKVNTYNYATHADTEIMCISYAINDEEPKLMWDMSTIPPDIDDFLNTDGVVVAHNVDFEYLMWSFILSKRYNWPKLKFSRMSDTMARALAMSYPGGLDDVANCLGLQEGKDKEGKRLMLLMCKPRKVHEDGTVEYWEDEDKMVRLGKYCDQDVRVTQQIDKYLLELSDEEKELFVLDGKINFRGMGVDVELAQSLKDAFAGEKLICDGRIAEITEGGLKTCNQVGAMIEWISNRNIECTSVAKLAVTELLAKELPDDVREVLLLRQQTSKSSVAKATRLIEQSNSSNRITRLHQYHGASTGRWAGQGVQPQNFPRNEVSGQELEDLLQAFKEARTDDIREKYGSVIKMIPSCLRPCLRAAEGHVLNICDFSSIEARVLAWLAGQEDALEVFRTHGKIYEQSAANIYKINMDEVTKDQRQIGKVATLALGFQGGKGAFLNMANIYGLEISERRAEDIKLKWRKANKNIVSLWKQVEKASILAVLRPTSVHEVGKLKMSCRQGYLYCRLPSGRKICYPDPQVHPTEWGNKLTYKGYRNIGGSSKKFVRLDTYGGKLVENITQGTARDVQANGMINCDKKGLKIVMHVHDETVTEHKEDVLDMVRSCMLDLPDWAEGLPMDAAGFVSKYYIK